MSTTVYGQNAAGTRIVSLDVAGMRVIVDPLNKENNQSARDLAERIERYEQEVSALRNALAESREERSQLKAMLRNERAINDSALTGRRRFFDRVVMVPVPGDAAGWSGPVLLLDPEKLFRGRSLQFSSASEVHREHPELWVVGTTPVGDGIVGVVLDAWGQR